MKIGFIGAGKVGTTLGKYLSPHHEIVGYCSLPLETAQEAAAFTNSAVYGDSLDLCAACDLVFITVPDREIVPVWEEILANPRAREALHQTFVAHCSGAISSEVFTGIDSVGAYGYSIHPLFAVASKTETYKELHKALFTIEGNADHIQTMVDIFTALGNDVQVITADHKTRYHAAAALASNHVVALYRIASEELVACGFSPEQAERALAPLFLGNAQHIAEDGVVASLTGPAERGDTETIAKHLAVLSGTSKEVYEALNEVLLEIAAEKHQAQQN